MMLIYAAADIHGRFDRLQTIRRNIETHRPDILVLAGDITGLRHSRFFIDQINTLSIPVLAVRGNSDREKIDRFIEATSMISSLHLNQLLIMEIPFIGLSGTLPVPFRSRICLRERTCIDRIEQMTTRDSVLVVHPPPWGFLDKVFGRFHAGCRSIASLILRTRPRLVICGHIHEGRGTAAMGNSIIVNCSIGRNGAGTLIKYNIDRIDTIELP